MKTKNQEIIKFQRRMYHAIVVASILIFFFALGYASVPNGFDDLLSPSDKELVSAITKTMCIFVGLCAAIVSCVFLLMKPEEQKVEGEVLDGE